jgi:hypothetical protein
MNSISGNLGDVDAREDRARRPTSELRRRIGERAGAVGSALSASFAAGDGERHMGRPILGGWGISGEREVRWLFVCRDGRDGVVTGATPGDRSLGEVGERCDDKRG